MRIRLLLAVVALALPCTSTALGDEAANAKAAFLQAEIQWREVLTGLTTVRVKYEAADDAEKLALFDEFMRLEAESRRLEPVLIEAVEHFYPFADDRKKELARLLMSVLNRLVNTDDHEAALALAEKLLVDEPEAGELNLLAGVAALGSNQFEKANQYLESAGSSGSVERLREEVGKLPEGKPSPIRQVLDLVNIATVHGKDYPAWWAKEQEIRAAEAKADDLPRVRLKTSQGDIVLELFENEAPNTAANFISLVESGFYDGLTFHRVEGGFVAQGGCPLGNGTGGPGYTIPCECHQDNFRRHFRGTVSMAHGGKDTGGSQFFLTFVPTPHLDGLHTAFGRIIEGFDVIPKLTRTQSPHEPPVDTIEQATVLRKRDHVYEPKKN